MDKLVEKLEKLVLKHKELSERVSNPEIIQSPEFGKLTRELGAMNEVLDKYAELKKATKEMHDSKELMQDESQDKELRAMAREDFHRLEELVEKLRNEAIDLLLTEEDADAQKNVIMEIRMGVGGEEAALFAADLFRMYSRYAERHNWKIELLSSSPSEKKGFKEISFSLKGKNVYQRLRFEAGGHRVQRVPETEAQGRVHTSAATVAVLPEVEPIEIKLDEKKDYRIDIYHSSGPGGQNVNKVASAVRLTHYETGIVVACQDDPSQHKNKARALSILRARLYDHLKAQKDKERGDQRRSQIGSGDRSDRIRTYNFPQNRLSDHQIDLTLYSLDRIMDGELDDLFDALQTRDREDRVAEALK